MSSEPTRLPEASRPRAELLGLAACLRHVVRMCKGPPRPQLNAMEGCQSPAQSAAHVSTNQKEDLATPVPGPAWLRTSYPAAPIPHVCFLAWLLQQAHH